MGQTDLERNLAHNAYGETGGRLRLPRQEARDTTPAVVGGQVLYLDFDGVLHPADVWRAPNGEPYVKTPTGHEVMEHASLLEQLLMPFPNVRIVLSTSWVQAFKSLIKVARRLPASLRVRVIGATYHSEMDAATFLDMPRPMQIVTDVRRRKPLEWLAIDDDVQGCPMCCRHRMVQTDPILGISAPPVQAELQVKLGAHFTRGV
jgi:hypothetical protein